MISSIQQKKCRKGKDSNNKKDYLQLPNGEYVEGAFDKIEYTDEDNDIFNVTHNGITQKMNLVDKN